MGRIDEARRRGRRAFLRRAAGAGIGAAAAWVAASLRLARAGTSAVARALVPRWRREHDWAMVFVADRCIDCGLCVEACRKRWAIPEGGFRTEILEVDEGRTRYGTRPAYGFLPVLCNHCDVPHCVMACPTRATYKREVDGVVVMDARKCIGCKSCMIACPYNARYYNPVIGAIDKCNYCRPEPSAEEVPDCVEACPAGVRFFGDLKDPEGKVHKLLHGKARRVRVLRPEAGTVPRVFYVHS